MNAISQIKADKPVQDTGYFDRRIALAEKHSLHCRAAVYAARRDNLHITNRNEYDGLVEAMEAETNGMNCWGFFAAVKTIDAAISRATGEG